jgi:AraC family transcriptional regulator of adaptative response/methylated-DNA-[protein]-cysteine methyltransferase
MEFDSRDYYRMEKAITFALDNYKQQPSLEMMAEAVHMSPYHFQRMFTAWVGVSPKKFIQYITLDNAKRVLSVKASAFDVAHEVGLSTTSRLHDLFVSIEAMTPAVYKAGGKHLTLEYAVRMTRLGDVIAASSDRGVCYVAFFTVFEDGLSLLKQQFPNAQFTERSNALLEQVFHLMDGIQPVEKLRLHLKGTPFQLKVWEALLKIPTGSLTTYGGMANQIGHSHASRAVGTAIGRNPIAYLIPCHRVIQQSGALGGYMWGKARKAMLLGMEGALIPLDETPEEK